MSFSNKYIASVYEAVEKRNAGEAEFLQAVREVLETIEPVIEKRPDPVSYTHLTLPTTSRV